MEFENYVIDKLDKIESKLDGVLSLSGKNKTALGFISGIIYKIVIPVLGVMLAGLITIAAKIY